jgi:hypothetical protein
MIPRFSLHGPYGGTLEALAVNHDRQEVWFMNRLKADMGTMWDYEVRYEILTAIQGVGCGDGVTFHSTPRMAGYQAMGKALVTRNRRLSKELTGAPSGIPPEGAGGLVQAPDYLMG